MKASTVTVQKDGLERPAKVKMSCFLCLRQSCTTHIIVLYRSLSLWTTGNFAGGWFCIVALIVPREYLWQILLITPHYIAHHSRST